MFALFIFFLHFARHTGCLLTTSTVLSKRNKITFATATKCDDPLINTCTRTRVCVCTCVCVRVYVYVCMRAFFACMRAFFACMGVCVRVCVTVCLYFRACVSVRFSFFTFTKLSLATPYETLNPEFPAAVCILRSLLTCP